MKLTATPNVQTEIVIRCPVSEAFQAFIRPDLTSKFWFTRSTGEVREGAELTWYFGEHPAWVRVTKVEQNRAVSVDWGEPAAYTSVHWKFSALGEDRCVVRVSVEGFQGSGDEVVAQALDQHGGFNMVLVSAKAFLEHGVGLSIVEDRMAAVAALFGDED